MVSPKNDASHPATRRRTVTGVIVGVIVLAVVAVIVIVSITRNGDTGGQNAGAVIGTGAAIAPSTGAGAVLPPPTGPAAATGSPVASDPAQPDVLPAVPLTAPAVPVPGLTVTITGLAAVDGVANGVGEVGGPAISFTVNAVNSTTAAVSLATTVVGVTYGSALTPANQLTSASTPMPLDVAAGATASGTYVFTVPADQRGQVQITVDYQAGVPVVVFEGVAP